MSEERLKPRKISYSKSKNRRILIAIYEVEDGDYVIRVFTKRLVDRAARKIVEHDVYYSQETFTILQHLFSCVTESKFWESHIVPKIEVLHWNISTDIAPLLQK
jgi:hypothetical protein